MTKIASFVHGIFPRSESLIKTTRGFDRHRATLVQLKQEREKNFKQLMAAQKKFKFSFKEDGKFGWQDIFRPFAENSTGLKVGSLTRHFDNNTFFRQPVVQGKIKFKLTEMVKYFSTTDGVNKVTFPSFFYFAKIADNNYYRNWENLLLDLATEFHQLAKELEKLGVEFIQLNDPYLVYHKIAKTELLIFRKALDQFKKGLTSTIALHTFFGDASPIFRELAEFPVDALGFDFFKTNLEDLPKQQLDKALICGCVNSRSPVVENKAAVKKFVKSAIAKFKPPAIYLTANSDLEFLTAELAYKKLAVLT